MIPSVNAERMTARFANDNMVASYTNENSKVGRR